MKTLHTAAGALLLAMTIQGVMALPLNYAIGPGSVVTANPSDPGLIINTSLVPGLSSTNFVLNDGQTMVFDFFNIWTPESAINSDDTVPSPISAYLDFAIPSPNSGTTSTGQTYGVSTGLAGSIQYGQVVWSGPVTVTAADRTFTISLSNETFNYGVLWGTGCEGAVVQATVQQRSSAVPDASSTTGLLALGLLALASLRRLFAT